MCLLGPRCGAYLCMTSCVSSSCACRSAWEWERESSGSRVEERVQGPVLLKAGHHDKSSSKLT